MGVHALREESCSSREFGATDRCMRRWRLRVAPAIGGGDESARETPLVFKRCHRIVAINIRLHRHRATADGIPTWGAGGYSVLSRSRQGFYRESRSDAPRRVYR